MFDLFVNLRILFPLHFVSKKSAYRFLVHQLNLVEVVRIQVWNQLLFLLPRKRVNIERFYFLYRSRQFLLVFDMNGNYIRTLDVGYKMMDFCIDEDNNRAIFAFSDEIQFGYLDLEKLIFR